MGKYLSNLGIKSVVSLQKHIIKETGREVICVKNDSGVKIIWCYNNSLHSSHIDASVIYVIQEHQITKVIKEIKDSIKEPSLRDLINKLKRDKPIKCYELHRANMPQYGCTVQCPDCKAREHENIKIP